MPETEVSLLSDFYQCKKCGDFTYSIQPGLLVNARCGLCRASAGFIRLEVHVALMIMKGETKYAELEKKEKKVEVPEIRKVSPGELIPPPPPPPINRPLF